MRSIKIMASIYLLFISSFVKAQINMSGMHNQNANLENSFLNPALIGREYKDVKFTFFSVYGNVSNNFTSAGDVLDYVKEFANADSLSQLSTAPIHSIMQNLKHKNKLYVGADVTLFNLGFNIHRNRKKFLDVQVSAREHIQANMLFNEEMLNLLYKGNKYYEGETIDILPKINALQYSDYGICFAKEFSIKMPSKKVQTEKNETVKISKGNIISIKPSIRLKYLVGNGHLSTEKSSLQFYTAPDGRYIQATLDGNIQQSYIDVNTFDGSSNAIFKSIKNGAGRGLGVDVGATATLLNRLQVGIGVVDNGSIRFSKNAYTFSAKDTFTWDGYDINSNIDSFWNTKKDFKIDSIVGAYNVAIGSKLTLSGSWGFGKYKKFKRYLNYYPHTVSVFYLQGFKNYLNSTTTPQLSVGYSYRYRNVLNAGVNATFGGLVGSALGVHISAALGPIQLGVASNSLSFLVNKYGFKGADANVFFALCF